MKESIIYLLLIFLISANIAFAESVPINDNISPEDKAKFDQILQPVFKIYNFIKYIASVVAAIFLLYSGITYMTSGSDPKKRDQAKNTAAYVVIGLIIIWAAPLIVSLLI